MFQLNPKWDTADAEIKAPPFENSELTNVLPLKPGVGQNVATRAFFTHCQKFLPCPNFYFPGPFDFFCFPFPPYILTASVLANAVSRLGPRNKRGQPVHSHKRFKQVAVVSAYVT